MLDQCQPGEATQTSSRDRAWDKFTAHLTARAWRGHGLRRSMGATGIVWGTAFRKLLLSFGQEHYYRHVCAMKAELGAAVDKWMNLYNHNPATLDDREPKPDAIGRSLRTVAA